MDRVTKINHLIDTIASQKSVNIVNDVKTLNNLILETTQDEKDTLSVMLANSDDLYQKYKYFLSLFPDTKAE